MSSSQRKPLKETPAQAARRRALVARTKDDYARLMRGEPVVPVETLARTKRPVKPKPKAAPVAVPRTNKFGAIKTTYKGEVYDSAGEARHAQHLDHLKAAGTIHDWRRGGSWVLVDAPKTRDRITINPDYEVWTKPGKAGLRVVDFKSVPTMTRTFRLKVKLWKAAYPDIPFYVVMADGSETRVA